MTIQMNHCPEIHEARFSGVRCLVVVCCLIFSNSEILIAEVPSFTQQAFALPASAESLVIADLNGDNLNDLVTLIDSRLRVYFQHGSGFEFESGFVIHFESITKPQREAPKHLSEHTILTLSRHLQ